MYERRSRITTRQRSELIRFLLRTGQPYQWDRKFGESGEKACAAFQRH